MAIRIQERTRVQGQPSLHELQVVMHAAKIQLDRSFKMLESLDSEDFHSDDWRHDIEAAEAARALRKLEQMLRIGRQKIYLSVVEDIYDGNKRRIRTLKSFGVKTEESRARAAHFIGAYEKTQKHLEAWVSKTPPDEAQEEIIAAVGETLGAKTLRRLLAEQGLRPA